MNHSSYFVARSRYYNGQSRRYVTCASRYKYYEGFLIDIFISRKRYFDKS